MRHWGSLLVLPWALWAQLETQSVPARGAPLIARDVIERFATYEACDRAARWAETQPDLREAWTDQQGRRYHTTMTYTCRPGGGDHGS